jgi:hypothetical protein
VGVMAAAQPITTVSRDSFVGENLAQPLILALRPLVNDILAAYGNPTSNLDRARALRDWVARTAVHPARGLHPDTSTANLGVIPPGLTWADVNAAAFPKINLDTQFWGIVGLNGYSMLDSLLGVLDPSTGQRANNGMMVHVQGAQYRIRDINAYHYVLCSYQDVMLSALWEAAGLQGMMISTIGHDPAAVFIPELGRWVYEDPTWDDEYLLDGVGDPLAPVDLLNLSSNGQVGRLLPVKHAGPNYDPAPYITGDSYVAENPGGYILMGSQLNNRLVGIVGRASWPLRDVQINVPALSMYAPFNDPTRDDPVTADVAFPTLGVVIQSVQTQDSVFVAQLGSTFPSHDHFERRLNGGSWVGVSAQDILPVGQCRVEYRSVDALGNVSAAASMDVWAPRIPTFVTNAPAGTTRAQAQYCP